MRRRAQHASQTNSSTLSERNERSECSELSTRRRNEHRSGVGATRRPLLLSGAACPPSPLPHPKPDRNQRLLCAATRQLTRLNAEG